MQKRFLDWVRQQWPWIVILFISGFPVLSLCFFDISLGGLTAFLQLLDLVNSRFKAFVCQEVGKNIEEDVNAELAAGDTKSATRWLRDNLQQFGALRTPRDTIMHATGKEPSVAPLLDYLEAKFGDLYGF